MTHKETKKEKKVESQKHSSPEILNNSEIEKHKSKGTIKNTVT